MYLCALHPLNINPLFPATYAFSSHSTALACLAMPSGGLSSLLAPKGQVMKHSTAILTVLLLSIVVLLAASSCEARGLTVHGKVRSSSKSHRLSGKDVAATSLKADDWPSRQMEARHIMAQEEQADAKLKKGMKMAASSAGAVRPTPTPVVTVSQRLSRQEDTGFHLDYAGPRTHTPSHN